MIVLISIFAISACKAKKEAQAPMNKIVLTLDWSPNTNHTGLYVAKELGYFKDEGLDVHIMEPGQAITDQVVASGKSHFGISYQENVIRARSENIPIVSIAAVIQHNTSGFASLKKDGITLPKHFEGKRYGSWDSPSELAILESVMKDANADIAKVKIVSGVYDFFSTIGKDADFEWIYHAWSGIEAELKGIELNYIPLKNLDPVFDYYTPVIITNEKMIETDPELVKRFMRAVSKGYRYCIETPDKAADIMIKSVPELNPELVRASQNYLAKEYQADALKWGWQDEVVWSRFSNWMYTKRLIPLSIEINKSYSNEFLP